ncbi:monovalent cation/H+ antiporter complex subunit F [Petrotoga olearia]
MVLIKLILTKSKWEKLLSYSSFSSKAVILMLVFSLLSDQSFLLDVIIIFLILNIWGVLIVSSYLERGGNKR